jgi:dipeptidyl aminopeptidase/acylaminoacyl peptidase
VAHVNRLLQRALLPAAAVVCAAAPAYAAPPLHQFASVSIAPDGRRVVAVESDDVPSAPKAPSGYLVVRSTSNGPVHLVEPCLHTPDCTVSSPAWSADSARIVFIVHDHASGTSMLELLGTSAAQARVLLRYPGELESPHFAPNGGSIAVLATYGAHKRIGATQAGAPLVGEIGAVTDEQRIALVDPKGALHYASPRNLFVYEYDWLPRGAGFVGTASTGNGDNNWWVAKLYAFANGRARVIAQPPMQIASPRASPDGRTVAFIGGLMSDFGSTGGDVEVVPASGGDAVDVTADMAASATSLLWNRSSQRVTFTQISGARDGIATVDVRSRAIATVWSDESSIQANGDARVSIARDGTTSAVLRQSFDRPPEIAVGPLGTWRDLTHANATQPPAGHARAIAWTNDGLSLAGWVVAPLHVDAVRHYGMVTIVHGGPSAAYDARYIGRGTQRDLLAHGYFLFLPNPRGSFGEGETFTRANVKDFGYGDLRDILAGVDAAEKQAPIDDGRLGIMGYSYGGYMTMWAVTQTQRFKAAVSGAGVSDWLSYYGENGIDEWMIPFFGASVYDDPAVYAKSSPIAFIKNVKTPTFEFVGERDVECPMPQSLEFWHALVTLGVPTSFVVYPGEGHGIRAPAHQRDVAARTIGWFERYLR